MDFSSGRRKLRGRRHGLVAPTDALRQPSSAQHAVAEFKWASDRHSRQDDAALAPSQTWTAAVPFAATTMDGHSKAGSTLTAATAAAPTAAPTAADAFAANEFKWISDYVDDAAGSVERQKASWQPKVQQQQQQLQQQRAQSAIADVTSKLSWFVGWRQSQQRQQQQQHVKAPTSVHNAVQPVLAAGAGTAAIAGSVAVDALRATTGAVGAAGSWLAGTGASLLDGMLGYDARLSSEDAAAPAAPAAGAGAIGGGSTQAATPLSVSAAGLNRQGRRWQESHGGQSQQQPQQQQSQQQETQQQQQQQQSGWRWHQVLGPQQPSTPAAAAAAPAALQQQPARQQRHTSAPTAAATAGGGAGTAGAAAAAGATGLQSLGLVMLVFGGVAALAREVADAAGAAYSETLLPAAMLMWQLAAAVGGLLSVIVMYLLLPLLRIATVLLQRLLRGAACLLQRVTERDEDLGMTAVLYRHQQWLLVSAQRQLAAACQAAGNPDSCIDANDEFRFNSRYFTSRAKIAGQAGYGPLAYEGGPEEAPVAVQLYILKDEQDVAGFCTAVTAFLGLRHPQLLRCIGAAVDIVPARNLLEGIAGGNSDAGLQALIAAAVGEVHKAGLETSMVVVGCLLLELLQQPASLAAGLQATAAQSSISFRPSIAAATSAAAVPAGQSLTSWSSRLQLAPQLVAGLQYFDQQLARSPARAQPAPAVAATFSTPAAAQTPAMSAVAGASWVSGLTTGQLADAVLLDVAAVPAQLKINPALMLLGQQQRQVQGAAAATPDTEAAAAGAGGLPSDLADVLLMLLSGSSATGSSSSSSTAIGQGRSAQQLQQLAQSRQAAELLPAAEQAAVDAAGLQIVQQVLQQVAGILAWQHDAKSQQQQQQQRHAQETSARTSTFSVEAAEALEAPEEAAEHQSQHNSQQAVGPVGDPAGDVNSSCAAATRPGWFSWLGRSRSVQQQQVAASASGSSDGGSTASASSSSNTAGPAGAAAASQPPATAAHQFDWAQLLHSLQQLADRAASWQQQQQQQQQRSLARPGSGSSEPPSYFICPITAAVMKDPVVAADGFTYERSAISRWLQQQGMRRSPMTNKPMEALLLPNCSLRSSIMEWLQQQKQQHP